MKKVLIRADSSSTIGIGHIMRDLVLAKRFDDSEVFFATRNLPGNINYKIKDAGFAVIQLNTNDIEELMRVIEEYRMDMTVIDHYGIDFEAEKKLKDRFPGLTLMVLDDTYEKHYCDILLNHNIGADAERYKNLVPPHCELQCGAGYTLIRDEFYKEKNRPVIKNKDKKVIFLAMGGADHAHVNISVLNVLKDLKNIHVLVVTTDANKNLDELKSYAKDKPWIELHINSDNIAKLMKRSDLAIITPSVILNEVYFMELPFIAIKTADNQKDVYRYLLDNKYSVLEKFSADILKEKVLNIGNTGNAGKYRTD